MLVPACVHVHQCIPCMFLCQLAFDVSVVCRMRSTTVHSLPVPVSKPRLSLAHSLTASLAFSVLSMLP